MLWKLVTYIKKESDEEIIEREHIKEYQNLATDTNEELNYD